MSLRIPTGLARVLAIAALATAALAIAAGPAAAYEGYHRLAEVDSTLRDLADEHPRTMSLEVIGTSAGGHELRVARIAAEGPIPPEERPGVFVGANVAGHHNTGTEAALGLIRHLLENAEGETAGLLAARTFYVAPVLHPDAHDALFAAVRTRRGGNDMTLDHDRDGLVGEDGFDDLDGDGRITELRIPDPAGAWLPHPDEPRVMVRQDAEKKWRGTHRVEKEGRDDDGDGVYNEDPEEGIVLDWSFPHAFPFPDKPEAGPWPGYAPEVKALFDFFLARRHISLATSTFSENSATCGDDNGGTILGEKFSKCPGGAIYLTSGSLHIYASVFLKNQASQGGAIYSNGGMVKIYTSTFSGNCAGECDEPSNTGGAIYVQSSPLTIDKSTFSNNKAGQGGAIYYGSDSLTINTSTFSGNSAATNGGAIYAQNSLTINSSTFSSQNSAGTLQSAVHQHL